MLDAIEIVTTSPPKEKGEGIIEGDGEGIIEGDGEGEGVVETERNNNDIVELEDAYVQQELGEPVANVEVAEQKEEIMPKTELGAIQEATSNEERKSSVADILRPESQQQQHPQPISSTSEQQPITSQDQPLTSTEQPITASDQPPLAERPTVHNEAEGKMEYIEVENAELPPGVASESKEPEELPAEAIMGAPATYQFDLNKLATVL